MKNIKELIKREVVRIYLLFFNAIGGWFFRKPKYDKKYTVVICGIFRNESQYLKEWLEYHKIIGIEHFYLYNNFSDDNYKDIIFPYIQRGELTLIDWPYEKGQMSAYKHFHDNFRKDSQWYSFLDIDEFFVPYFDKDMKDWIKKHDKYPVIMIEWKMFGTSGKLKERSSLPVIEQYINCWEGFFKYGKCMINSDYEISDFNSSTHHCTKVKGSGFLRKVLIPTSNSQGVFVDPFRNISFRYLTWRKRDIQINHYWSKSLSSYIRKQQRPDVFYGDGQYDFQKFYDFEINNITIDYHIYRFLIKLKQNLNNKKQIKEIADINKLT